MFYVGLDIHDKRIAICVLGETGQIVRRAQVRAIDEMMRDSGRIPRSDVAQYDAAVLNGSDRILSRGAPPWRMTPNGCLGNPAILSLPS
jgi:hypothetical protein